MSFEPPKPPIARATGVHISIALLALTIAVFLGTQLGNASQQNKLLRWQIDTGAKQITNAKENAFQLSQYITQQDTLVKQSAEIQNQYQKLLDELLKLSEEDEDAKAIVAKWKVQRSAGDTGARPAEAPPVNKPADKR